MWPFEGSHHGVSVRRRNLASLANIFQLAQVTLPVPLRVGFLAFWLSGGVVCPHLTTEAAGVR